MLVKKGKKRRRHEQVRRLFLDENSFSRVPTLTPLLNKKPIALTSEHALSLRSTTDKLLV